MRVGIYRMTYDKGFAPNPFWGYCTVMGCTPNYRKSKLGIGEWIAGRTSVRLSGKQTTPKLIYAMKLIEKLHLNDYFHDERFADKKPKMKATRKKRCGDNMYYLNEKGVWNRLESHYHKEDKLIKDTKYPYVFISNHFYYFGENAISLPDELQAVFEVQRGIVYKEGVLAKNFVDWLESNNELGIHGKPHWINS